MGTIVTHEVLESRTITIRKKGRTGIRIFQGPRTTIESDLAGLTVAIGEVHPDESKLFVTQIILAPEGAETDGTHISSANVEYNTKEGTSISDDEGHVEGTIGFQSFHYRTSLSSFAKTVDLDGKPIKRWQWNENKLPKPGWEEEYTTIEIFKPAAALTVNVVVEKVDWKELVKLVGNVNSDFWNGFKKSQWLFMSADVFKRGTDLYEVTLEFELNIPGWNTNPFGEPDEYIDADGAVQTLTPHDYTLYNSISFKTTFGSIVKI